MAVFDGNGGEWSGRLVRSGKTIGMELAHFDPADRESPLRIVLAQGLPAADKMDWIVQKAVELGVTEIQPVATRRSVVRLSGERMEKRQAHWQAVAISACEQCGRNRVPKIGMLLDLPQFMGQMIDDEPGPVEAGTLKLMLAPGADKPLTELIVPDRPIVMLIGPEGGIDDNEIQAARVAGFQSVVLGPRILRTETAGLAALAAVQALIGDWQGA